MAETRDDFHAAVSARYERIATDYIKLGWSWSKAAKQAADETLTECHRWLKRRLDAAAPDPEKANG